MHLARSDWRYRSFFALNLNPEGRLLEVGCGSGLFMKLAAAQGYQVEGIDADPSAIHAARHLYGLENVRVLSAEELLAINPGDGLFDVICLFDVLEHLEEPLQVVRGLGQRLAAGGYLVCTVPDHQRWPKLFALDVDLPPHHLTLWTPQALQRCFENGGLEPWLIKPSPLLGETLLHQASLRWGALRRLDLLGKLLRGTGHYLVMPIVARLLSMVPQAGGFTLLGVARRAEGGQTYG
jgi:SAM-dependent methyltransferase